MPRMLPLLVALAVAASFTPAYAWKGARSGGVDSAADVQAKAEKGDAVTVEGEITEVGSGPGSLRLAVIEDGSGEVTVAVAEYLRREIEREPGEDPVGVRVRVSGTWEHGYLKQDRWAIRATSVERLPSP